MMRKSYIRPGLLVQLCTKVRGGVFYDRQEATPRGECPTENGTIRRIETEITTLDAEEHRRATQVRSKCQDLIRSQCFYSTKFRLLCPQDREDKLQEAIEEAERLAAEFNATARYTWVSVDVSIGVIRDSDERTARGIADEVRGILEAMEAGVRDVDAEAIRAANRRAVELAGILDEQTGRQIAAAVEDAKVAAREITRRIIKGQESRERVLAELKTSAISAARFALLDTGPTAPAERISAPSRDVEIDGPAALPLPAVKPQRFNGLWIIEEKGRA